MLAPSCRGILFLAVGFGLLRLVRVFVGVLVVPSAGVDLLPLLVAEPQLVFAFLAFQICASL